MIVSHNEQTTDVFFIVSGKVRVTIYSNSGRDVTYRVQGAGQMFGELSAIDDEPRSAHVLALEESLVASMTAEAFWAALKDYPPVAEAALKRLATLVRQLSDRVFEFSTLAVKNRIHAELLRLGRDGEPNGNASSITPAPTHADVASRISTHREAVTRELNELTRAGLIERNEGALVIQDMTQLAHMVEKGSR